MNVIALRVVRHTRDFHSMLHFYQDILGMTHLHGWEHPKNRGALLAPGGKVQGAEIEVLDLDDLARSTVTPNQRAVAPGRPRYRFGEGGVDGENPPPFDETYQRRVRKEAERCE